MRLDGKVALITGAGSGMGQAAAVLFAQEGAKVAVCDVNAAGVEATLDLVRRAGKDARGLTGYVGSSTDWAGIGRTTVSTFGKLNVLYSNAAIYLPHAGDSPVADLDEGIYDRVLAINLKGVYLCAKHAIPEMIQVGGGSIINVSSLAGTRGSRQSHAYAMAKGGVLALTLSLASTYGAHNIRANAIAPGSIETPMIRNSNTLTDAVKQAMLPHLPLGRVGTPNEVAQLALFLASDESAYMTGTVQIIDGGFSLG